jgi:hypothetical protein
MLAVFSVTTAQDNGVHPVYNDGQYIGVAPNTPMIDGSLTMAIYGADQIGGSNTIDFAIGSGPQTIAPPVPSNGGGPYPVFPIITCALTIDGTTQPGYTGQPVITLSEAGEGENDFDGGSWDGLELAASGSTITGLNLDGFGNAYNADHGVAIRLLAGASGNSIAGNSIGSGLEDDSGGGNTIGGTVAAAANDFYAGSAGTLGASLGLDTSGTTGDVVQGNSFRGPIVVQSAGHTIGGTVAGSDNVIDGALWLGLGNPGCSDVVVEGNLIGTNAQGTTGVEEQRGGGVEVDDATDCTIGGTTAAARNLISDNATGIEVDGSSGIVIEGNYIGTDITGNSPIGNLEGISIDSGSRITIGGTTSGAGNVISGNPNGELSVTGSDVLVAGNLIGTNASGTAAMPNPGDGESTEVTVINNGPGITIGGTTAGSGNVVGGSKWIGLAIQGSDVLVEGNDIGVTATGVPLGDRSDGVLIDGTGNTIGGTVNGAGNTIANNSGDGIGILGISPDNPILGNSIYDNGVAPYLLGIDLNGGGNDLQPAPALTSASVNTTTDVTNVACTLQAAANTTFRVEFFANSTPDSSGHYEGQAYVGAITMTTDANGNVTYTTTLTADVSAGQYLTATATDPNGNTSQFSKGELVTTQNFTSTITTVSSSADPSVVGQLVTFTATVSAASEGGAPTGTVTFMDGSTTLGTATLDGSATAAFTTSALSVGTDSITAVYSGDANFASSTSTVLSQVVNQASTSTAETADVNPSLFGQSVTLTAMVAAEAPGAGIPTGMVTFMDGMSSLGTGTLDGTGTATLVTSALAVGTDSITADYSGDGNFTDSTSGPLSLTVNQANTTTALTVSPSSTTYGQPITLTATIAVVSPGAGSPTGSVEFFDGSSALGIASLSGNSATLSTTSLTAGAHSLSAQYLGDGNFIGSTSAVLAQIVGQASTSTSLAASPASPVFGQLVTLTATVSVLAPGNGTPTGTVTFLDDSSTLGTSTLNDAGTAYFSTSALTVGSHSISAVYGGDGNFTASTSSSVSPTVSQASTTTSLTGSVNPSVFGQSVTFTAAVTVNAPGSGTPTGSVSFDDGTTVLGSTALSSGVATFSTNSLDVETHSITAVYNGDGNFFPSTSDVLSQVVNLDSTSTALTASINPAVFGHPVTFTATVTANAPGAGTPTGTISFMEGSNTLDSVPLGTSDTVSFSTSALAVGSAMITAIYSGDNNFLASSTSTSVAINQASTTTSLAASPTSTTLGQPVALTATIGVVSPGAGAPTGSVQFFNGTTSLGTANLSGNSATLTTSTLPVGTESLTAEYLGDSNFSLSTSSAVAVTIAIATTIALTSSTNPSVFGQSVTFAATVTPLSGSGTPTGSVIFYDGSTSLGIATLSGKKTSLKTASVSIGSQAITADYSGDSIYASSTSAVLTQTVNQDGTTTKLSSAANPSVYGQAVTFTATVAAASPGSETPTGTVTFSDGATTLGTGALSAGVATFTTTAFQLPLGSGQLVTAVYSGDVNFTTSSSTALSQTVNQDSTTTSLTSSTNPSIYGQAVTFAATVTANTPGSGTPTGTVTFSVGSTSLGTGTLIGDEATFTTSSPLSAGSDTIKASYSGDTNFKTSAGTLTQTVNQDNTTTSLVSSANPSVYGQSVTFSATVASDAPGSGTPTGSVTFTDGSITLATVTLSGGAASYSTAKLLTGQESIFVTYNGSTSFLTSSASVTESVNQDSTTATVSSSANPSVYGQAVTFTATVTANAPGAGTPTGTVTFCEGSTSLGTGTLSGGKTTLKTTLLPTGSDAITVVYGGDGNFTTSTSAALTQTVNQDATTTKLTSSANPLVYGQSVVFTATVTASSPGGGTPTGTVTFMDGTTAIGTGTLSAGITTFTTSSLAVASHSITAVYSSDSNFMASISSSLTQTVNQSSTTTSLVSSLNPSTVGQSVTFTATISATSPGSGTPTGSVTFYVNSKSVGTVSLTNDAASDTTTFTATGSDAIKAVYSGDSNFKTSTGTLTQTVNSSADVVIVNSVAAAVDQVLGTVQVDSAAQSPIDELALDLVTTQGRRRRVGTGP